MWDGRGVRAPTVWVRDVDPHGRSVGGGVWIFDLAMPVFGEFLTMDQQEALDQYLGRVAYASPGQTEWPADEPTARSGSAVTRRRRTLRVLERRRLPRPDLHRGPTGRYAGRRSAFQAVRVTCAVERDAEAAAAFSGWGYDVRGAEHRACRLKPAFPAVASPALLSSTPRGEPPFRVGLRRARCGAPRVPAEAGVPSRRVTCAVEFDAEVGAAFSGWSCAVRGAEHRACRLKPAFQAVASPALLSSTPRWEPPFPGGVAPCAVRSTARAG